MSGGQRWSLWCVWRAGDWHFMYIDIQNAEIKSTTGRLHIAVLYEIKQRLSFTYGINWGML